MNLFAQIAHALPAYRSLVKSLKDGRSPVLLVGASEIHKAHLLCGAFDEFAGSMLVLTHDEPSARALIHNLNAFFDDERAVLYPQRDFNLHDLEASSREYEQLRISVLRRLLDGEALIVVASIEAVLQYTLPPAALKESTFSLAVGDTVDVQSLAEHLTHAGYESRSQIEGVAQFSIRGGIIDIYPPALPAPVRIELWDDEIDTMSFFEVQSQRRTDPVDRIEIIPACEIFPQSVASLVENLTALEKKTRNKDAKSLFSKDIAQLKGGVIPPSYDRYLALIHETPVTLFDYFPRGIIAVSEYTSIRETAKTYLWQQQEDQKEMLENGELTKELIRFDTSLADLIRRTAAYPTVFLDTFAHTNSEMTFTELISVSPVQTSPFSGELKLLEEDVRPLLSEKYAVFLLAGTQKSADALAGDLRARGLPASTDQTVSLDDCMGRITVLSNHLTSGFEYPEIKVSVITTGFQTESRKRRTRHKKGRELKSLTDLSKGDLVVHVSHGIGVFEGVEKLEMQGVVKDYIKISYAGSDVLFVPVTQMDLVSKYIGTKDDTKVKLNKLHSTEWQNTRRRAKQAVAEMADELIALYAKRMQSPGYAFSEDTEWQKDFEQHFAFSETDDQLRCTDEIKHDMEQPHPMDRVLCGDVGFGKTEVAMRAAFKCVSDGKQCAVLCPTTILAWQHYQTFLKRFEAFPVNIEVLSRFRTPKQQKEIVKKAARGQIDILIGTHRIVQKDIEFKDLGLAIVDEEQRFGVKHKERFKEMFTGVDMLTLSATPIPRTLNMAISGIRDMSVIEQAPMDRHPVQTYVIEYNAAIISDAIKKELRRGGQVYYIHNRIETIEHCAAKIQSMVPQARIAIAHGRMEEHELSEIWRMLLEHEVDILVCTTLIETGVDVANCNTLIIEDADHMGLSQLYQLRGRVGRSTRRAFAYFTFTRGKVLTEIAAKRLSAIREFTKFGSGFRIALRDLEIRGAGSILGARQHGHMEAVGYEMYLRLLSEAIAEKKGEPIKQQTYECQIDLRLDAHIPETYISELSQRIDIYKKIAAIHDKADSMDVIDELIDRFGDPPAAVLSLVDVALLRNTLASFGFEEINEKPQGLLLYPKELDMEISAKIAAAMKNRVLVNTAGRPHLVVKSKRGEKMNAVAVLREVVDALTDGQKT